MRSKMFLKAATKLKNIALLTIIISIFIATGYLPLLLVGAAGYVYFVLQTAKDEDFLREYNIEQKVEGIQNLSTQCDRFYMNILRRLPNGMREKLKNIYVEKQALMGYYSHVKDDPLKQKIVEQALNLVMVYFKLMYNYSVRAKEIYTVNVNKVEERLKNNRRKKDFLKNPGAMADLEKAIELDERLLEKIRNEKNELEMVHSKMDYIESAIVTFKHQIISNTDSDPVLSDIDSVVNEAIALDDVLSNRNNRMKL